MAKYRYRPIWQKCEAVIGSQEPFVLVNVTHLFIVLLICFS